MRRPTTAQPCKAAAAFVLAEALVGAAILGIVFVALYGGIIGGLGIVQSAREQVLATQILTEKFETLRLYNWDQINATNFIPATFLVPMDASLDGSATSAARYYTGAVAISSAPVTTSYSNDLRMVNITLSWAVGGNRVTTQSMQGFVARYGLQSYIY